jgi:hypothetical protein
LGANNPVVEVENEASDVWCADTGQLMPLVKCLVSVGTGDPGVKAIEDRVVKLLSKTMVRLATETKKTNRDFVSRWRDHYERKQYYRFNVDHGLENVGLQEFKEQGTIEAATELYLDHQVQTFSVRDCVLRLKSKQSVYI